MQKSLSTYFYKKYVYILTCILTLCKTLTHLKPFLRGFKKGREGVRDQYPNL